MEQIRSLLEERKKRLLQIKNEKEKALKKAPEGSLRICVRGKKAQYYHRNDPKDFNGIYIPKKDDALAQNLAQKDYDKKVLYAAERELNAITKYLMSYPAKNVEQIYQDLHRERQKLIVPIMESEEEFVQKWEQVEFQGKGFYETNAEFHTAKGERVRSKSELIIADLLKKENIPYRYECPIYLNGLGRVHPDFTVLNVKERKEIYWEHLGMMDDPVYAEKAIKKIAAYEKNGIFPGENLILTYETRTSPIEQKVVALLIERYLK